MGMVIAFFVRHFRKRRRDRDFDPTKFRRSAIALPDENEKNGGGMRPRPPSMIERKNLVAKSTASAQRNVPAPSMAYPYSDQASAVSVPSAPPSLYGSEHGPQHPQYGAAGARYAAVPQAPPPGTPYGPVPGAYGVPPPLAPYNGAQYEQAGYGAPPIPGTYGPGAYASYGAAGDPRYPQYPHNKPQGYPQFSAYHQQAQVPARYAQQPQQPMYGYAVPQPAALPAPMQNNSVRSVSASPASPPPSAESVLSSSSTVATSSSGHRRQPTQSSGAPPAYEDDEDSKRYQATRDQKIRPVELGVQNGADASAGSSSSATTVAPAATAAKPTKTRSNSIHTVYDDGDVYGGM
ncbi:hypothetical protein BDN70DRAFT_294792 [Pholiota conissans]|uniref:Uncharacterized protein n=1 Tax=Pholiota conissans TaxID=109636 RepID=A0A9P5YVT1_9AGAR|nr:hypothetical protein BDN70DRAFT_294792 [Pholiota conissans]